MKDIKCNNDKRCNDAFAKNLSYYLKKEDMTQSELSEKIGVSQGTVSDWKRSRSYPRIKYIEAMAAVFGIDKADLIEDKSVNNTYFLEKESSEIALDLRNHPESMKLYIKIKKLSPPDRELITELINCLTK